MVDSCLFFFMKCQTLLFPMVCSLLIACLSWSCSQKQNSVAVQLDYNDSVKSNREGIDIDSFCCVPLESGKGSIPISFIRKPSVNPVL